MEKRKYEGLDVPVEPKLDWYWLSDTSAGCEIGKGGDLEDCAYTYCHKCIYSRYNAAKRNAFYKEFIDNTPAIGQKASLDKTCARLAIKTIEVLNKEPEKEQEEKPDMRKTYKHSKTYIIPTEPKKEWAWMTECAACSVPRDTNCRDILCKACIYAYQNGEARTAFYKECFEQVEEKPKVREYFRGLVIPKEPEKGWTWMRSDNYCPIGGLDCDSLNCGDCIYSLSNLEARKAFYKSKFKEEAFEIGDIVEYDMSITYFNGQEHRYTITTPILAVRVNKEDNAKEYLTYGCSGTTHYIDLSKYKVRLVRKAK